MLVLPYYGYDCPSMWSHVFVSFLSLFLCLECPSSPILPPARSYSSANSYSSIKAHLAQLPYPEAELITSSFYTTIT